MSFSSPLKIIKVTTLLSVLTVFAAVATLVRCKGAGGAGLSGTVDLPPHLIHVLSSSKVGFYDLTGQYGFGSASNSILDFGVSQGAAYQVVQGSQYGVLYVGQSCTGCDSVTYVDSYHGRFSINTASSSQLATVSGGKAAGVAVDDSNGILYIADNANNRIYFANPSRPAFYSLSGGSFAFNPSGTSVQYLAFESTLKRIFATDPVAGSIVAIDGRAGTQIATTVTPLKINSAPCTSGTLGYLAVAGTTLHVLCSTGTQAYDVLIATGPSSPGYKNGTLSSSSFSLSPLTIANDLVYDSADQLVFAVGGSIVAAVNANTGAVTGSFDLSSNDCGASGISLSSVAYASDNSVLIVSDSVNSRIYLLNPTTLGFKNGLCSNSSFTTPEVVNPIRVGFF